MFEKEIRTELAQMEQEVFKQQDDRVKERYDPQIQDVRAQIAGLITEIAAKTTFRDSLAARAVQEADGTGGSKHRNLGPIYRTKKAEAAWSKPLCCATACRINCSSIPKPVPTGQTPILTWKRR